MRGRSRKLAAATALLTAGAGAAFAGPAAAATAPLAISTAGFVCSAGVCSLGLGNVGDNFEGNPNATGGTVSGDGVTDFGWAVVAGSLPPGLTEEVLGSESAMVFGTPTKTGTYDFTLQTTDNAGATARQAFSITIGTGNLDRVVATVADYTTEGGKLVIDALDANTGATLTVSVTSTGQKIGVLNSFGTGEFDSTFFVSPNPQNITVTSSLGGSGTLATTLVSKPY
jgi:large repetitive protein